MSHRPNQPVLASRPPGHAPVRSGLPAPLLCGRHVPSVGLPRPACPGPYGSPRPPSAPQSARMCPSRPVRCVPGPAPACLQTAPPCPTAPVVPPRLRGVPARTAGRRTVVVPDARRGRSHTTGCGLPCYVPRGGAAHTEATVRRLVRLSCLGPRPPGPCAASPRTVMSGRVKAGPDRAPGRLPGRSPSRRTADLPGRGRRGFLRKNMQLSVP